MTTDLTPHGLTLALRVTTPPRFFAQCVPLLGPAVQLDSSGCETPGWYVYLFEYVGEAPALAAFDKIVAMLDATVDKPDDYRIDVKGYDGPLPVDGGH